MRHVIAWAVWAGLWIALAAAIWWLIIHSFDVYAVLTLALGIAVILLLAPRRAPERIP